LVPSYPFNSPKKTSETLPFPMVDSTLKQLISM
jgi:hypothetical protein